MIDTHTHDKDRYSRRYGRMVEFWERPERSGKKRYREPVLAMVQWFKSAASAERARRKWGALA